MKIAVAGCGYVGLSIAVLLAQRHQVTAVDVIAEKVDMINDRKSPIQDEYIEYYLAEKRLNLTATVDGASAYRQADYVVIAAPTNYDSRKNHFDTSAVEAVIGQVMEVNPEAVMVIKSTIPVGYTQSIREKTGCKKILFSPEFLRESMALYDNLYPSRIIVGTDLSDGELTRAAQTFAGLLKEAALKDAMILDRLATDNTGYLPPFLQTEDAAALKSAARAYREAHPEYKHPRVALLSDGTAAVAVWTKKHPVTERGEVEIF